MLPLFSKFKGVAWMCWMYFLCFYNIDDDSHTRHQTHRNRRCFVWLHIMMHLNSSKTNHEFSFEPLIRQSSRNKFTMVSCQGACKSSFIYSPTWWCNNTEVHSMIDLKYYLVQRVQVHWSDADHDLWIACTLHEQDRYGLHCKNILINNILDYPRQHSFMSSHWSHLSV
jgi:hypothetical protein